jgi:hypothetical protein
MDEKKLTELIRWELTDEVEELSAAISHGEFNSDQLALIMLIVHHANWMTWGGRYAPGHYFGAIAVLLEDISQALKREDNSMPCGGNRYYCSEEGSRIMADIIDRMSALATDIRKLQLKKMRITK